MKEIPLTQGKFAIVDDSDYEILIRYRWHFNKGYAVRIVRTPNSKKRTYIGMHNVILGTPEGMEGEHRDGNGLNNLRSNLRICTHAENMRNHALLKRNKYGLTGIYWRAKKRRFTATIYFNCSTIHLGTFKTIEEAKRARIEGENKYFGEFRRADCNNIS